MTSRFLRGFGALFRALPMVLEDGRLRLLAMLPALITLVAAIGAAFASFHYAHLLLDRWSSNAWLAALFWLLLVVVVAAATWVAYLLAGMVATAPFADAISERAETLAGEPPPPKRSFAAALRGLGQTLLYVAVYLLIVVPLFVVNWFVPVLAPFAGAAGLFATAVFFSYDAFDSSLTRRGLSFADKWRYLGDHRAETLGLGAAATLASLIPFAGVIVPPLAIAAASRLYCELKRPSSGSKALPS